MFCCPACSVVLSAQVDPLLLKIDTVSELMDEIQQELHTTASELINEFREELHSAVTELMDEIREEPHNP